MNSIIGVAIEQTDEAELKYKATISTIPRQVSTLKALTRDSPRQAALADSLESECDGTLMGLEALHKQVRVTGLDSIAYLRWVQRVRMLMGRFISAVNVLAETASVEGLSTQSQVTVRDYVGPVLALGLIANLILSLLLSNYFSKGITTRLGRLADNSKRLATNLPLTERLAGDDEIASVDKAFHDMATALNEAIRKETAVIEQSREVICSISPDGKFAAINPAARLVWRRDPDDLLGRRVADVITEEERNIVGSTFASVISSGVPTTIETRILRPDCTELDVLWSINWSASENVLFCVVLDNSERKELERIKRSFMQMVAHDLRSPLTSILGTMHLLSQSTELSPSYAEKVGRMERVTERLLKLVNDLLEIESLGAKSKSLRFSRTSSGILIDQAAAGVESLLAAKSLQLKNNIEVFDLDVDADRVVQVLINLLSNSVRFSPRGSVIQVSVCKQGAFAEFSIADQGPGIQPQDQKEIFEPFKQVKEAGKKPQGTGLGLAIAKAIAEAHGGEIGVESNAGSGSRFWFSVLLSQPAD